MKVTQSWDEVMVGEPVPAIELDVTALKTASVPAVTLDQFAAHYDIDVAQRVGLDALSLNTMQLIGLANRHATDWAGPGAFIMRQDIRIIRPAYQGYRLTVSGEVAARWEHAEQPKQLGCVEIACRTVNQTGAEITSGAIVLALPRWQRSAA